MCPVAVTIELFAPMACFPGCDIAVPDTLTCDVTLFSLDASGSSAGDRSSRIFGKPYPAICQRGDHLLPLCGRPGGIPVDGYRYDHAIYLYPGCDCFGKYNSAAG